ncbi:hypothetical protein EGJ22_05405 [Pseudomonas sp. p99-361]|nr:hypothetical protein EGJ22_05405 [Pseudomonas sp. p99-361]
MKWRQVADQWVSCCIPRRVWAGRGLELTLKSGFWGALRPIAGKPAPTGWHMAGSWSGRCGSGHAREEPGAVAGTGYAGVRGHARSHKVLLNQ